MRTIGIIDTFKWSQNKGEVKKEAWGKICKFTFILCTKTIAKITFKNTVL